MHWGATVLLGLLFIMAFIVYLAADLVSRDLLDPELYNAALAENAIYSRVYTDLLADPAMAAATAQILGNLNLNPELANNILNFTTSTLILVLPPPTIQSAVEGSINGFTAYLKGDTAELQPRMGFTDLDADLLASRLTDSVLALSAELLTQSQTDLRSELANLDEEELATYLTNVSEGEIGPVPASIVTTSLESATPEQREQLVNLLLSSAVDTTTATTTLQIEAALQSNDLPSAVAIASRVLLQERMKDVVEVLINNLKESEALNTMATAGRTLGQTQAEIINNLNTIRSIMIFLDGVAIPLALIVMVLTLGVITWIHSNNLIEMLRTAGGTLLVGGIVAALAWIILRLVLQNSLADRFTAGSELPSSLENMISDVVTSILGTVWQDVWQTATIPVVIGLALIILSFIPNLPQLVRRWLEPVWQYHKIILVGILLAIVIVPLVLRVLLTELRQPELVCNGHSELCDRPVNEIAYAGTHNAMSITEYGWLWPSHDGTITNQLDAGVRALLIDTHYWDDQAWIENHLDELPSEELQVAVQGILDTIELSKQDGNYLCHMMCGLGATELEETLAEIKVFLDNHPNEVVLIVIEDLVSPADTESAFADSGLLEYVYTHRDGRRWPTIRELIRTNQRVLVMAEAEGPPPDWYLNAYTYTEETPYHFSALEDFDETSCQPNRGDTDKPFFLFNHWITRASPSRVDASILNEYDYLLSRVRQCEEERGQMPNIIGVNFYLNGDVFEVVDELNGVRHVGEESQ